MTNSKVHLVSPELMKEGQPIGMQVVNRDSIPAINSILVDGESYNLGELRDFHKHDVLARFIPQTGRVSMSWVHLKQGEVLEPHMHPTASLIIICEGEGQVFGDCQQKIVRGDNVVVPPNHRHGFVGGGKEGFWALSIQFEGTGLYEDQSNPRVQFVDRSEQNIPHPKSAVDLIVAEQRRLERKFEKNPLMLLARSGELKNAKVRERLLEALNSWSDWFQKILAARMSVEETFEYFEAAGLHLQEEIGHNKILYTIRKNKPVTFWDPLLDSAASWFHHQMLTGNDHERTVLMHLVMEGASTQFHTAAKDLFQEGPFFELHSTLDEDHFGMGVRLLENSKDVDSEHLITVLHQGWSVFSVIAAQMANYATGKIQSSKK